MAHNGNQDKGRRLINLHEAQIGNVLPDHFKEAYPKFITLLEKYYEFQDQNDPAELINHLFDTRDITETDLTLLTYIEDELLLGERYAEGFPDRRAAANFSSILFRSKGSKYSIEWFFRSFFGEDVEVIYPKNNVFNIGSSSIGPDSEKYITNNELYQTFSLLIKAGIPFSRWREMFKLFAHPAGMYLGAQVLLEGVGEATVSGDGVVSDQTTASYSMAASADPETEGETVTITVTGTNTPHSGTEALYWYIVHGTTDNDDFNMTVPTSAAPQYVAMSGSSASFDIVLNKDLERDDGETYTVYLINQYDRVLDTIGLTINDDLPVYTVSSPTATEGSDLVFNITLDDDFYDDTTLNWALTGDLASDGRISATSGTVSITGQSGVVTITTTSSDTYQGATTGTLTVSDTRFSPAVTGSGTATLNDASATYSIAVDPAYAAEGTTVDVDVSGTNISASTLYLAVTHGTTTDADFSTQPPGQGATAREAIAISGNAGTTTLTYASNSDVTNETFTVELWDSLTGGTKLDEFEAVITAQSYTFTTISDTNLSEFNEDTATFTFTTTDGDGTYYYWFETVSGTLTSDDFQAGEWKTSGSRGTFTVTGGTGTFSVQALADGTLEGNATFKAYVSTGAASAAVADSQTDLGAGGIVTVTDDSTATYSVVANNVTEGSTFSFTVTASNYDNEDVDWTITGDAASRSSVWSATSGTITSGDFSGGVATVLVTTTDNASTDSPDPATGTLTVTGATGGSTANDTFELSDPDPVILPTYSATVANITEGDDLVVNIDATNNNGETVYIEVTGSGVTGRVTTTQITTTVSTDTAYNFTISGTTLSNTYQGNQAGTVTIGRGDYVSGTGTLLASDTFTMSDAALTGTISSTDGYAIDEDQGTYNWAVSGTNLADTGTASYYWIITSVANPTVFATTDATANSGQAVIPLADTTDIAVGYKSTNASVGGTVVSKTSGTVTMSTNLTGTLSSGTNVLFYDADLDNKFSAPSGEVTMSSNAGTWTVTVSEDTTQDDFTGTMALYQGWGTTLVDNQSFTVSDLTPNAPTITSPTNGSYIADSTPTITISGAPASHSKTDWQIAEDASFTTIHEQSLADASNLTSYTVVSPLTEGVTYYVRARTYTNDVESAWSSTVSFEYWSVAAVTLSDALITTSDPTPTASHYWINDGTTLKEGSITTYGQWINETSNPTFDPTDYEIEITQTLSDVDVSISVGGGITLGSFQDFPSSGTSITASPSGSWSPITGSRSVQFSVTIREKADTLGNTDTQTIDITLNGFAEP